MRMATCFSHQAAPHLGRQPGARSVLQPAGAALQASWPAALCQGRPAGLQMTKSGERSSNLNL